MLMTFIRNSAKVDFRNRAGYNQSGLQELEMKQTEVILIMKRFMSILLAAAMIGVNFDVMQFNTVQMVQNAYEIEESFSEIVIDVGGDQLVAVQRKHILSPIVAKLMTGIPAKSHVFIAIEGLH